MDDVANSGKMPGGITGKGFRPGQTGNPDGVPGWVKKARDQMRDGLFPLAAQHLKAVLGGPLPADATADEREKYAAATLEDRTAAARLVLEYSIPKPKTAARVEHAGAGGQVLSFSVDMGAKR